MVAEGVGPTQREEVGVLCLAAAQGRCDVISVRGLVGVLLALWGGVYRGGKGGFNRSGPQSMYIQRLGLHQGPNL